MHLLRRAPIPCMRVSAPPHAPAPHLPYWNARLSIGARPPPPCRHLPSVGSRVIDTEYSKDVVLAHIRGCTVHCASPGQCCSGQRSLPCASPCCMGVWRGCAAREAGDVWWWSPATTSWNTHGRHCPPAHVPTLYASCNPAFIPNNAASGSLTCCLPTGRGGDGVEYGGGKRAPCSRVTPVELAFGGSCDCSQRWAGTVFATLTLLHNSETIDLRR